MEYLSQDLCLQSSEFLVRRKVHCTDLLLHGHSVFVRAMPALPRNLHRPHRLSFAFLISQA